MEKNSLEHDELVNSFFIIINSFILGNHQLHEPTYKSLKRRKHHNKKKRYYSNISKNFRGKIESYWGYD